MSACDIAQFMGCSLKRIDCSVALLCKLAQLRAVMLLSFSVRSSLFGITQRSFRSALIRFHPCCFNCCKLLLQAGYMFGVFVKHANLLAHRRQHVHCFVCPGHRSASGDFLRFHLLLQRRFVHSELFDSRSLIFNLTSKLLLHLTRFRHQLIKLLLQRL